MSAKYLTFTLLGLAAILGTDGFVVKGPKNVPRIGRSYTTESEYVLNSPKNIPRMGRRAYEMPLPSFSYDQSAIPAEDQMTYYDEPEMTKNEAGKVLEILANAIENV